MVPMKITFFPFLRVWGFFVVVVLFCFALLCFGFCGLYICLLNFLSYFCKVCILCHVRSLKSLLLYVCLANILTEISLSARRRKEGRKEGKKEGRKEGGREEGKRKERKERKEKIKKE